MSGSTFVSFDADIPTTCGICDRAGRHTVSDRTLMRTVCADCLEHVEAAEIELQFAQLESPGFRLVQRNP